MLCTIPTFAQTTFGYEDFKNLVLKNHPTVKQANLFPRDAEAEIMQAKGAFDPKLTSYFDRKSFKGIDYYNRWDNVLKIPTWSGVDFKLGYERNTGKYLLQEESSWEIFITRRIFATFSGRFKHSDRARINH